MKTISRIAYSNDKKNKTRSILIMMSICLTTMLLVIISTVGNGMIRLQKSQAAGSYGSNYGLFVAADASQLKEVSRRAEIDAIGIMCTEGIIKGNENGGFVCMDETARKMLPYNKEYELKEGKYPGGTQEIAAGRAFFRPGRSGRASCPTASWCSGERRSRTRSRPPRRARGRSWPSAP